jgi:hypothetical protein
MVGFYRVFLVIALGVFVSAADFSLFDIFDISLAKPCEEHNTAVRKEWFVFFFFSFPTVN